ncbi:MAG TPA: hypothetical protein VK850_04760 [Candidatus Binatia bacterium]|nr:hypothetical protein [Candidatus Binatia bacterium]
MNIPRGGAPSELPPVQHRPQEAVEASLGSQEGHGEGPAGHHADFRKIQYARHISLLDFDITALYQGSEKGCQEGVKESKSAGTAKTPPNRRGPHRSDFLSA